MTVLAVGAKLKIDYTEKTNAEISDFVEGVIFGLATNLNFTGMTPYENDLKTTLGIYRTDRNLARGGEHIAVANESDAKDILIFSLRNAAIECNRQQSGNKKALMSSFFELVKERGVVGPINGPTSVIITPQLEKGTALFDTKFEQKISGVLIVYMAGDVWDDKVQPYTIFMKQKKKIIGGIMSGVVTFKIAGVGASDVVIYSDPITRTIV